MDLSACFRSGLLLKSRLPKCSPDRLAYRSASTYRINTYRINTYRINTYRLNKHFFITKARARMRSRALQSVLHHTVILDDTIQNSSTAQPTFHTSSQHPSDLLDTLAACCVSCQLAALCSSKRISLTYLLLSLPERESVHAPPSVFDSPRADSTCNCGACNFTGLFLISTRL